jgi:hypothetical protein
MAGEHEGASPADRDAAGRADLEHCDGAFG